MGSKYTEGQKKATANYMKDKHMIRVVVTKEKAEEYKAIADNKGLSLNKFITNCIEESIKADL